MIRQGENLAISGYFDNDGVKITDISLFQFMVVIISHELGRPVYVFSTKDNGIEKDLEGNFALLIEGTETAKFFPGWYGVEVSLLDEGGKVIGSLKKAFRLYPATHVPDSSGTGPVIRKDIKHRCNAT
jgi:hypothetical protein